MVRDTATLKHVKNMGVQDVKYGGCPTIFLGKYNDYKDILPESENVGALISIRKPSLVNLPQNYQTGLTDEILKTIEILRSKGYKRVRILCNDSRDCEYASNFRDFANVDFVYTSNVFDYLSLISNADLVVSFRLHATLPALSFGTPVVNISYDERAEQLVEDLQMGEWDVKYIKVPSMSAAVEDRLNRLDELKKIVENAQANWKELEQIQLDAFRSFHKMVRNKMIDRGIIKK